MNRRNFFKLLFSVFFLKFFEYPYNNEKIYKKHVNKYFWIIGDDKKEKKFFNF